MLAVDQSAPAGAPRLSRRSLIAITDQGGLGCQVAADGERAVMYVSTFDAGVFAEFGAFTPSGPLAVSPSSFRPPADVFDFDLALRGNEVVMLFSPREGGLKLARKGVTQWEPAAGLEGAPMGTYVRPRLAFDARGGLHVAAVRVEDRQIYYQAICP